MIFRELIDNILDLASQDAGGDFEDMTKAALNREYRRLLNEVNQDTLRREFTLTTASGTSKYGMPLYVKEVLNIEDPDNDRRIYDISQKEFDVGYPGGADSGDPWKAYPLGRYGVQAQPATATTITAVSSSPSDTGAHLLRVTGYNSAGVLATENLIIASSGATTSGITYGIGGLERLAKRITTAGTVWIGNITVATSGASPVTLAVIPVWWDSPTYLWYEFYPIPDSAITYTVRAIARKPDLVNNEDWPEFDEEFHWLLEMGAAMEVLPIIGKMSIADRFRVDYDKGVHQYRASQNQRHNRIRVFSEVNREYTMPGRPLIEGVDFV